MEINKDQLAASLDMFESSHTREDLNRLYGNIPGGTCSGCAKCCTESVHAFYVEFLNIYTYLKSQGLLDQVMDKIEDHYFKELTDQQDCPFLVDGKCVIYPVRPLVCRLFGYATREEHEANYACVLEMNEAADAYFFETYSVHIDEGVKHHKIEYCETFEPGRVISLHERQDMVDEMFQMDSKYLMEDLIPEDAINMSITNWFIYLTYTEEEASDRRIETLLKRSQL